MYGLGLQREDVLLGDKLQRYSLCINALVVTLRSVSNGTENVFGDPPDTFLSLAKHLRGGCAPACRKYYVTRKKDPAALPECWMVP